MFYENMINKKISLGHVEIGEISPDGYFQWNGTQWLPIELGTKSKDGFWIWNGSRWVPVSEFPQSDVLSLNHSPTYHPNVDPVMSNTFPQYPQQQQILTYQQTAMVSPNLHSKKSINIPMILILFVFSIALVVVLSGVLYVWASSLAEEDDITGTWYNPNDTVSFYPDGTINESTGYLIDWSIVDGDLVTGYIVGDELVNISWKYDIIYDTEDDKLLIIAPYEFVNGNQTNEVVPSECVVYSELILGTEEEYFENIRAIFPDWCEPIE
jgi:hypothetical protein